MKEEIERVSKERLNKCINCPFNSTEGKIGNYSKCKACGCFLKPKSKCLSCSCGIETYNANHPDAEPLPLEWTAIITDEQEDEILNKLNNESANNQSDRVLDEIKKRESRPEDTV